MRRILVVILVIFAVTFYFSCKKKETASPSPPPPTKEELLTGGSSKSWALTRYVLNDSDLTYLFPPCRTDDIFLIKSDNSFLQLEGNSKCNPKDSSIYDWGYWALTTDKTKMIISSHEDSTSVSTILELTSSKLRLLEVGDSSKEEYTFTAR